MDQVIQNEGLWWVTLVRCLSWWHMLVLQDSPGQWGSSSSSRKVWRWMKMGTRLRLPREGFQTRGLTGTVPSSSISLALWQMKTTRKQRDRPILMRFWSAEGPDPRRVWGHGQTLPLPCHLWRQKAFLQRQPPLQALNAHTAAGVQLCLLSLLPSPIPLLLCLPEICLLFIAPFIILLTGLE